MVIPIEKKKQKKYDVYPIDIQSTPTDTTTTTSGQAITGVFGPDSEFVEIVKEREKPLLGKYCSVCKKWFSILGKKCPKCGNKLE